MKHASRDLPRVIHTAMPVVIVSYLLANVSYYLVLPGEVVGRSNTIAVVFLLPPSTGWDIELITHRLSALKYSALSAD